MLNDIHNHWKHGEAVRVKCLGVPTVDMQNVCHELEVASSLLYLRNIYTPHFTLRKHMYEHFQSSYLMSVAIILLSCRRTSNATFSPG
jgi:hypothetical protein